jgi:hypothetical protein
MAQAVEHLPSKHEALSTAKNLSTAKKQNKKKTHHFETNSDPT